METLLFLLAVLSLLAFIVGMFSPKTVLPSKIKQDRGFVTLIYLGGFFVFAAVGSGLTDSTAVSPQNIPKTEKVVESPSTTPAEKENTKETVYTYGDQIAVGHFIYVLGKPMFKKTLGNEWASQTADGLYMIIPTAVMNTSKETRTLDSSSFFVTDMEGYKYESSIEGETALEMSGQGSLFLKETQPKIWVKGFLVFEVPEQCSYYVHLAGNFWGTSSTEVLIK